MQKEGSEARNRVLLREVGKSCTLGLLFTYRKNFGLRICSQQWPAPTGKIFCIALIFII